MAASDKTPAQARWEAVKEFLRLVVFATIGAAIAAAGAAVNVLPEPWMVVGAAALIASLGKAWDKYVHKSDTSDSTGVLPF